MRSRQKIKTRNEVFSARGLPSLSRRRSSGAGDVHVISKHLNGRRFEVVWNASVPINGLAKVRESSQPKVRQRQWNTEDDALDARAKLRIDARQHVELAPVRHASAIEQLGKNFIAFQVGAAAIPESARIFDGLLHCYS